MLWHLLQLELVFALLLQQPVVLGKGPAIVPMLTAAGSKLPNRVLEAARAPAENVLLVLKGIEAKARPEVSWEVYVEPAGTPVGEQATSLVGVVSLFGQERGSAEFVFAIDKALVAAGGKGLQVRFVPTSGVVIEGAPQAATVRSPVTIGEISLAIETAKPERP
jgi:hypothetical protein